MQTGKEAKMADKNNVLVNHKNWKRVFKENFPDRLSGTTQVYEFIEALMSDKDAWRVKRSDYLKSLINEINARVLSSEIEIKKAEASMLVLTKDSPQVAQTAQLIRQLQNQLQDHQRMLRIAEEMLKKEEETEGLNVN